MSESYGTAGQARWAPRGCAGMGWRPLEIVAAVAGFAIWWPLGLAVIAFKVAQKKGYVSNNWIDEARSRMRDFGQGLGGGFGGGDRGRPWRPFENTSGNAAFDDWRKAELDRLAEERRKLDAAEREFAEHMETLRRARDREEFDRFMQQRRGPTSA